MLEHVECPPVGPGLRRLVDWVADYYLTTHAAVLRMVLASSAAFTASGTITEYRRTRFEPARLTPQRAAALDALEGVQGLVRELAAEVLPRSRFTLAAVGDLPDGGLSFQA